MVSIGLTGSLFSSSSYDGSTFDNALALLVEWVGLGFHWFQKLCLTGSQYAVSICASRILDERMMFLTRWQQTISIWMPSCNKQPRLELKNCTIRAAILLHFSTAQKIGTSTKPIIQSLPLFPQLQEAQIQQSVSAIILYTCPLQKSFSYVLALLYKLSKHLS